MSTSMHNDPTGSPVPLIDFAAFAGGDAQTRQRIAAEIGQACREVGFFYLANHGVDAALLDRVFDRSEKFFDAPDAVKEEVGWRSADENLGYVATGRESLDPTQPGDYKEAFNITEDAAMNPVADGRRPDNRWPSQPDDFAAIMQTFYAACVETADNVLRAFAIALDMPPEFFVDHHDKHDHGLRLLHYPPAGPAMPAGAPRAGAHTDYGSITLLFQDGVGGLEVRDTAGQWHFAPPIDGTVLVNTGDLMQRWTNDIFRSTAHRVGASLPEYVDRSRYSAAFFCHPNYESEITCLDSCQTAGSGARYAPINSQAYLLERLGATY